MSADETIRTYLDGWRCGPIKDIALAYDHPKAKVYDVTLERRSSLYVILGYGPPAHYEKNWIDGTDRCRAVLAQYVGSTELIKAEVNLRRGGSPCEATTHHA